MPHLPDLTPFKIFFLNKHRVLLHIPVGRHRPSRQETRGGECAGLGAEGGRHPAARVKMARDIKGSFALTLGVTTAVLLLSCAFSNARAENENSPKPGFVFDEEYGKHIVDFNNVAYCPDGRLVESWTCSCCNKTTVKNFKVDTVIHEFELNIMAYTGYSPSLGKLSSPFSTSPSSLARSTFRARPRQ